MIKRIAILAATALLAGCAHQPPPAPAPVYLEGPTFAPSEFKCPGRVMPPDGRHRTAADAVKYENRLEARGDACASQLGSVGRRLDAAGQVAR